MGRENNARMISAATRSWSRGQPLQEVCGSTFFDNLINTGRDLNDAKPAGSYSNQAVPKSSIIPDTLSRY